MTVAVRFGVVVSSVALVLVSLTACSSGRSTQAFCDTLAEHKKAYLAETSAAQSKGLAGIAAMVSAVGDLKVMWKDLADVAPSEIQSDVENVRDTWQKQEDNAANGKWVASVVTGLLNAGSMSRVDAFVRKNCDGDYSGTNVAAGTTDSASPQASASPAPTEVGPVLSDRWTNDTGYGYALSLTVSTPQVTVDIANAAPGYALINVSYALSGTVTNTTAGHNAPIPTDLMALPLWLNGSPICAIESARNFNSNSDGSDSATKVCGFGGGFGPPPGTLTVSDGTTTLTSGAAAPVSTSIGLQLTVPQDQAQSISGQLAAPPVYAIARAEGNPSTLCLVESGGYYVSAWTAETGCTKG